MRNIKIIHGADFHLDSPFEGLTTAKAAIRRQEQGLMLKRLAELADRESADLMLLAGDLLESDNAYSKTGEELVRWLETVPCPVVISPGNGDYYSDHSPYARLKFPDNTFIFHEPTIGFVSLPSADARVYGAAFTNPTASSLLRGFHAERKAGIWNLLCLHGEHGNPSSQHNPITEDDIAACGMDYAALGHVHTASGLRRSGGCHYAWPGCPEGRGFTETGEKYVYVVELTSEGCRLRAESISVRQYHSLILDITEKDPLLLVHTSLPDDTIRDVYRITLTGETMHAPDLNRLHQNLDEMFFSLQLKDQTTLNQEIWKSTGDDSLRGIFLKKLRILFDSAQSDSEKQRIERAARWGLAALDSGEEVAVHDNP